jgi:hypothetical protein
MSIKAFARRKPIIVRVLVAENEDDRCIWIEGDEIPENAKGSEPESMVFTFRWPNWKDDVSFQDEGMEVINGVLKINASKMRRKRFETLLSEWSLVDDQGQPLGISPENIDELDPDLGNTVMDRLDKVLGKL